MAGFECIGVLGGGNPRIGRFTMVNDEVTTVGAMLTLTSNEARLGTTNDTAFIGVALEALDNAADGKSVRAICDPYAIYAYKDGTAHAAGATLDLGTNALATTSNADFTVIEDNTADEATHFIITPGEHYLHGGG